MRIQKLADDTGKKVTPVTLEDLSIDSSAASAVLTDNLRAGGNDRSYTFNTNAITDSGVIKLSQLDFSTYFTSGENVINCSTGDGLVVWLSNESQANIEDLEHVTVRILNQLT